MSEQKLLYFCSQLPILRVECNYMSSANLWLQRWKQKDPIDRVRISFIVLMQVAFVFAFFLAFYERAWLTMFISIIALGVVWMPSLFEQNFHVHFPLEFEFLLNVFIYSSLFLGEMQGFYTKFWWWDIVLHAGSGIALGFLGFLILFSLYRSEQLTMNPMLLVLFSFCFALALGVLWEIFEFAIDSLFGFNMQNNGIRDTMWDLIVNTLGAGVVGLSGYFYILFKWHGTGIFEHHLNAYFSHKK